jgi:diguanylate cyclase (GGDEF)-like protein
MVFRLVFRLLLTLLALGAGFVLRSFPDLGKAFLSSYLDAVAQWLLPILLGGVLGLASVLQFFSLLGNKKGRASWTDALLLGSIAWVAGILAGPPGSLPSIFISWTMIAWLRVGGARAPLMLAALLPCLLEAAWLPQLQLHWWVGPLANFPSPMGIDMTGLIQQGLLLLGSAVLLASFYEAPMTLVVPTSRKVKQSDVPATGAQPVVEGRKPEPAADLSHVVTLAATGVEELDALKGALETVVFFLAKNFGSHSSLGYLSHDGGETFQLGALASRSEAKIDRSVSIQNNHGIVGKAAFRPSGIITGNVRSYSEPVEYYTERGIVSSLMVARIMDLQHGNLVGLLVVDSPNINAFKDDDFDLLNRFAKIASQLISNVKMSHEMLKQSRRAELTYQLSAIFASHSDTGSILKAVVKNYPTAFGSDRFYLCDRVGEEGRILRRVGEGRYPEGLVFSLADGEAAVVQAFTKGEAVLVENAQKARGRFSSAEAAQDPISSLIAAPIVDESGAVAAVVAVESDHPGYFGLDTVILMRTLNANASTALGKSRVFARLERQATIDGLTGIPNHRHFQDLLDKELARHQRAGKKLSLLLMDIDHFKKFNDTYGHPVGDEVLRVVARALKGAIRAGDHVARYGGEEFVIVLETASAEESRILAERVRASVEAARVPHETGPLQVTISIGSSTWPEDASSKSQLIESADQAMYGSKERGRNRVTLFREMQQAQPEARPGQVAGIRAEPGSDQPTPQATSQHQEAPTA